MYSFKDTYSFQFKYQIPHYLNSNYFTKNIFKKYFKFYKRYFYIFLNGQLNLEVFSILPEDSKILWINISAPSIGDSLMDLSSRILIENKEIDLFTDKKNAHLYENDNTFKNIYTDIEKAKINKYDLVILDSYSSRSIKIKSIISRNTPYVGMYGFFNGPEVNRILFSFHQMNKLLGYVKTESEILKIAKNNITISVNDKNLIKKIVPNIYIAIVIGGEWRYKTYQKWIDLIEKIFKHNEDVKIVLIGSKNGKTESNKIVNLLSKYNLVNLVSKLSFNQTAEVIRKSDLLICCDGGLMHAGFALNAKAIVLLARLTPKMLLANDTSDYLFDEYDVNNIEVEAIFLKYIETFNFDHSHL
jgi:ADP-heptose:LPS heptosyltransferase